MTRWIRVCLAISAVLLVAAGARRMHAQTGPKIAWDESSGTTVNGYALTIDGVRTDYKLSPLSAPARAAARSRCRFRADATLSSSAPTTRPAKRIEPADRRADAAWRPVHRPGRRDDDSDGSGSNHPAGTIVGYTWSWGDGTKTAAAHLVDRVAQLQRGRHISDHADRHRQRRRHSIGDDDRHDLFVARDDFRVDGRPLGGQHADVQRPRRVESADRFDRGRKVALWNPNAGAAKICAGARLARRATSSRRSTLRPERRITCGSGSARRTIRSSNDSVHVQFSDSTDANRAATLRIGSTSSAEIVLQNGPNAPSVHGWGWSDNGWGSLGGDIYFASTGAHTVRVQAREDGAIVDQIVLSPDTLS